MRGPSRRELLKGVAAGFGYLALAGLATEAAEADKEPLAPRKPHHVARARRVIFLFMHGGPSQVDTFDYKPRLQRDDGKELPFAPSQGVGALSRKLMASPWKFNRHGTAGLWVSELFPCVAKHADNLCVLSGMHTEGVTHGQATLKLHTGAIALPRPSLGSWVLYGLGTENRSLPGFVTICPPRGHGGVRNYGNAFLPAVYQGTAVGSADTPASRATIRHIANDWQSSAQQRQQLDLLQAMNVDHLARSGHDDRIEGVIESYELAFRMQMAVPQLTDLGNETASTRALYGIDEEPTNNFGRQCLLARRFAEAGVRFVQVSHSFKWDQHHSLKKDHERNAREVDRPIAGLLRDLDARGLLDDTLVLWGGEFGRTPVTEGKDGRDHNPHGFTMWLAGGGVRGGMVHGSTDEFGYHAIEGKVHMHDLHATLLYLLGLDHEQLTYRHDGRDFRLTDVHGRVVGDILA
ncbi:MAG TPA: DUF1501 domain-containing protein [Gemmataceae bacterium]|nr:DUF1501 domain-containing protein [Gemmataceae bacterium]